MRHPNNTPSRTSALGAANGDNAFRLLQDARDALTEARNTLASAQTAFIKAERRHDEAIRRYECERFQNRNK